MTTNETKDGLFGDVIYQYTRAQAIEDGILVDVTETAKEAGVTFPTTLTTAVWADCVAVPEKAPWQDEMGRLWDVLTMLRYAIVHSKASQQVAFSVAVQNDAAPTTTSTAQSPVPTGRPGRAGHHDHAPRGRLAAGYRRLPRSRRPLHGPNQRNGLRDVACRRVHSPGPCCCTAPGMAKGTFPRPSPVQESPYADSPPLQGTDTATGGRLDTCPMSKRDCASFWQRYNLVCGSTKRLVSCRNYVY